MQQVQIEQHKLEQLIKAHPGVVLDYNTNAVNCIFEDNIFPCLVCQAQLGPALSLRVLITQTATALTVTVDDHTAGQQVKFNFKTSHASHCGSPVQWPGPWTILHDTLSGQGPARGHSKDYASGILTTWTE